MINKRTFTNENQRKRTIDGALNINDPFEVRAKGCEKRLKSSKEKSTSKTRQCRGCGRHGVSHDKRNCPNLQDRSTLETHHNSDGSTDEEDFTSIAGEWHRICRKVVSCWCYHKFSRWCNRSVWEIFACTQKKWLRKICLYW